MKKDYKNIEELFKGSFDEIKIEPSQDVWKKINTRLNLKDFVSANFKTFNIYYLSVITGIIATLIITIPKQKPNNQQESKSSEPMQLVEKEKVMDEKIIEIKTYNLQKKNAVSRTIEIYSHQELKSARESQNSELLPLPLRNNLKEFSKIYGDTLNKIAVIKVSPPVPLFEIESKTGCAPFEINLKNKSKFAQYYEWNFGDGTISNQINPIYTYQYPGKYSIKLQAIGIGGIAYSIIDSVVVMEGPKNKINWNNQSVLLEGEKFVVSVESQNTVRYEWNFGDGYISNQKRPEHKYLSNGKYAISLKSWTNKNCVDSVKIAEVEVIKTESLIAFPTAFFPNQSGPSTGKYTGREIHNEIFHPVVKEETQEYHLMIYSKEGTMIFETKDIHIGWDGYYEKRIMPEGVYPYVVTGKFEGGREFLKKGNLTIIYRQ